MWMCVVCCVATHGSEPGRRLQRHHAQAVVSRDRGRVTTGAGEARKGSGAVVVRSCQPVQSPRPAGTLLVASTLRGLRSDVRPRDRGELAEAAHQGMRHACCARLSAGCVWLCGARGSRGRTRSGRRTNSIRARRSDGTGGSCTAVVRWRRTSEGGVRAGRNAPAAGAAAGRNTSPRPPGTSSTAPRTTSRAQSPAPRGAASG